MWLVFVAALALTIGALVQQVEAARALRAEVARLRTERYREQAELRKEKDSLHSAEQELADQRAAFDILRREHTSGFPWLADAFADYGELRATQAAHRLETKSHPAVRAAEQVRAHGKERRAWERLARIRDYQLRYYETLFPWLADFRDLDEADAKEIAAAQTDDTNTEAGTDPARAWLSEGEYANLAPADKFQRALDRYLESRKSNWQVGRDYERFVGYTLECQGFQVEYRGALDGLADMGRDLIATRGGEIRVVQCKRWASTKTVHEKHVFQLFGSALEYELQLQTKPQLLLGDAVSPVPTVFPVLVTSATVSELARRVADRLGVRIEEGVQPREYPMIKCNAGRRDGERIYHLPFDQQYDRVRVERSRGERWASTIAEAEQAGFRRAHRWRGVRA